MPVLKGLDNKFSRQKKYRTSPLLEMSHWKSIWIPASARPYSLTNHKYISHQIQNCFTLENKGSTFKRIQLKETQNLSVLLDDFLTNRTSNPSTSPASSLHSKTVQAAPFFYPVGSWWLGPVHKSWNKPRIAGPSSLRNVGLSERPQPTLAKLISRLNFLQISSQDVTVFGSDRCWVVESKEHIY